MRSKILIKAAFLFSFLFFNASFSIAEQTLPWKISQGEGTFLVLSDIHFNPYADGSLVPELAKAPVEQWEAIFQKSTQMGLAPYGVDTNYALWHSCLEAVKSFSNADYVLVNGDYLSHKFMNDFKHSVGGGDKAYVDFVEKTLIYVSQSLQDALPNVPIYFCLGNNDSDCDDYEMTPRAPMLPPLKAYWKTVAKSTKAKADFDEGGYYVVKHPTLPDQEFIVLNDVFWAAKYANACGKEDEHPGVVEMNWLKKKLDEARKDHLKVTLVTHMPLGTHKTSMVTTSGKTKPVKAFWKGIFTQRYSQLMSFYRDVVRGMFSGHIHMDDFWILSDSKGTPYLFDHITPAVSPIRNNNPGFQLMEYDRTTGQIKDMATYYCDLTRKDARWALEYTFDQAYGLNSYDAASLKQLSDLLASDGSISGKFKAYIPVSARY